MDKGIMMMTKKVFDHKMIVSLWCLLPSVHSECCKKFHNHFENSNTDYESYSILMDCTLHKA